MKSANKIYVFLVIIVTVLILIYAQSIIIPFILAFIVWSVIRVIKNQLLKIKFVTRLPRWLVTIFSSLLLLGFLAFGIEMISKNISQLSATLPVYQENVNKITEAINTKFNIDIQSIISTQFKSFNFPRILSGIFGALTGIFGSAFTVVLYLIFILLEEPLFPQKIKAMYPDEKRYKSVSKMINKIDHSISNYIALKTVISILTGFLSYFALIIIGVDAPFFWAFLIFVLNYIPTIGSLIATTFPAIFAMLQFGDFTHGLLVLAIVGVIQLVIGNFVEPRLMGNSLNISPLVVLLTLAVWGLMWGITGMLLSVPITVIIIIILSEFPATQPIAVLLSHTGKLNTDKID
ncbi:MAG: permease [Draconibacterium sp.]|nr:MAG: permease [Draconibacterium sp.]